MELSVVDIKGKATGKKVSLADSVFGIEPNDHAIYLDVKQFLANQRQGTHKAKERAEVAFSTRKIKKQKGTGGARAGSRKSPVFVGGGTIFGPRPRDYSFKLNKKLKALARKSALAYKAKGNQIAVVDGLKLSSPKTKDFIGFLTGLALIDKKTLVILPSVDKNIYLSSRNLSRSKVVTADMLTTYDLVNAENLLVTEESVKRIEELLS